jgi:hypothetical protein
MDNTKIDLRGIEWKSMDWISVVQVRGKWRAVVNTFGFREFLD